MKESAREFSGALFRCQTEFRRKYTRLVTVVVVAGFVLALGVVGLVGLLGITSLSRLERVGVRACGVRVRNGKLLLELDGATLGAGGNAAAAHERLELVIAGFADEVENWHDRLVECS